MGNAVVKKDLLEQSITCANLRGKHVLITGTTGFVGKVVLEKLLRVVPDIGGIYLLIRGNKKHPQARDRFMHEIASSSVFEHLKLEDADAFERLCDDKIHCVTGEVTEPCFGMPKAQFLELAGKLDAIINSAASVNFREELDVALKINTLSLRNIISMAALKPELAVVQVSTCYVNGFNKGHMLEEVVRPVSGRIGRHEDGFYEVDELINVLHDKIADVKSRYRGEQLKEKLVELGIREANHYGWNDTYTFTKWMGEQMLLKALRGQSLSIVRPSIVESTLEEPVPGWIEGVKVADALMLAYAREKLTFFPGKRSGVLDVIPADLVSNSILLALAEQYVEPGKHRIYQACSGGANPLTLGRMIDELMAESTENYQKYDRLFYRRPRRPFVAVDARVFELVMTGISIPVGIAKRALNWLGQEKDVAAIQNFETARKLATIFAFYAQPSYIFHNDRLLELAERMGEADKALFPVDSRRIDWTHYLRNVHLAGLNRYGLTERKLYKLKPKGQKKQRVA